MQKKGDHTPRPSRAARGTIEGVALRMDRIYVAPDASSVLVAEVGGGLFGRRLRALVREPLAPGTLDVSPAGANLQRPEHVRSALARALDALGRAKGPVTLVLPEGLARLALLAIPPDADPREFARFRLAASLPWPSSDAIVEVLPVGAGQAVAAAVRRSAVTEYEQLLDSAGFAVDQVLLAPLVAMDSLRRTGPRDGVHLLLGEVAVTLVAVRKGRIAAVRCRRRDPSPGEATRLVEEAARTASAGGDGAVAPRLVWAGVGAAGLSDEAGQGGTLIVPRGAPAAAAEVAWLRGALG